MGLLSFILEDQFGEILDIFSGTVPEFGKTLD